jgi:hypothetical protein
MFFNYFCILFACLAPFQQDIYICVCSLGLLYELLILHFILVSCLIKVVFDLRDSERRELRY